MFPHPQVEFEARGPQEKDFHGIVHLLKAQFKHHNPAHTVDLSRIADHIIGQRAVGSVIIQGTTAYVRAWEG